MRGLIKRLDGVTPGRAALAVILALLGMALWLNHRLGDLDDSVDLATYEAAGAKEEATHAHAVAGDAKDEAEECARKVGLLEFR